MLNHWLNCGPRTTNHCEGWHRSLRDLFDTTKPELGTFLEIMQSEVQKSGIDFLNVINGDRKPKLRHPKYRDSEIRMYDGIWIISDDDEDWKRLIEKFF